MQRPRFSALLISFALGCTAPIRLAPVRVEPIHMTIDVNVHDDGVASANRKP